MAILAEPVKLKKLAVAMIVRDEAETLVHCLESVKEVADEFVICDTGSSDGTLDVARGLLGPEAKLLIHPQAEEWREHPERFEFDTARNFALEQVESEWILSLDCDEQLSPESFPMLKEFLANVPGSIRLGMVEIVMCDDMGQPEHSFWGERLIRRGVRFRGHQHNWVDVTANEKVPVTGIKLLHCRAFRPSEARRERDEQRHAMAENHFRKALAENPKDRRSLFYLAGDLKDRGNYEEAVKLYCDYLNQSEWTHERYQAALFCARCLHILGRRPEAKQILINALHDNWQRAEGYIMLGDLCYEERDIAQAEHWYRLAYGLKLPEDPMFLEQDAYSFVPPHRLAHTRAYLGDSEATRHHSEEAIAKGAKYGDFSDLPFEWLAPKHEGMRRMAVFVDRGQYDFIDPLLHKWKETWDIRTSHEPKHLKELLEWADVAWFEWAGELLIQASRLPKTCRVVTRVHGYEVHAGYLPQINWRAVDDIIFTANYLGQIALEQVPLLSRFERRFCVPGGIDVKRYRIAWRKKKGNKVAMACYLNYKKNLPLALQVFVKAREKRPNLELHIAGQWQDSRLQIYLQQLCGQLELEECVFFHGWQKDLNSWFADKDFFLSSSIEESFQYALAEAMACGLKPAIHCWLSADQHYSPAFIFRTVDEGAAMLQEVGDRHYYRRWVEEYLSLAREARRLDRILHRPRLAILGEMREEWRIEPRLQKAFEDIGCNIVAPQGAEVVLACNPGYLHIVSQNGHHPLTGKKVIWYAEQVVGNTEHAVARRKWLSEASETADAIFVSHPAGKKWIAGNGKVKASIFLGGAHWGFPPRKAEKEYDLGFYGVPTGRRKAIIQRLSKAGHKVAIIESYNPNEVGDFISKCRAVLNIHATPQANVETRIAETMSVGSLVLTETLPSGAPFPRETYWQWKDFKQLLAQVERLKEEPELAQRTAQNGNHYVWNHLRLEQQAERLLDQIEA